jgi:hypothetical protein
MAKLDFPAASASPFVAPNGVTYTYIGTEPTGHWSGTEADGSISLESKFVEITGDDMSGDLTLGTNKITLDATGGSATFGGMITGGADNQADDTVPYGGVFYSNNAGAPATSPATLWLKNSRSGDTGKLIYGSTAGFTEAFSIYSNGTANFTGMITAGVDGQTDDTVPYGGVLYSNNGGGADVAAATLWLKNSRSGNTGRLIYGCTSGNDEAFSIYSNGSAEFAGTVKSTTFNSSSDTGSGFRLTQTGNLRVQVPAGTTDTSSMMVFNRGSGAGGEVVKITADGKIQAKNVTFNLEADDDTKYTSTTDSEGNVTRVYNGAVLDVKDRLQKADAALQTLKTAAAASTDFASLKSAIATALADI